MKKIDDRIIYDMELHGILNFPNGFRVKRVPGGWIYDNKDNSCVFVPFNDEFAKKTKKQKKAAKKIKDNITNTYAGML